MITTRDDYLTTQISVILSLLPQSFFIPVLKYFVYLVNIYDIYLVMNACIFLEKFKIEKKSNITRMRS